MKLFFIWLGTVAASMLAFIVCFLMGRASDCRPGQIDGQCGLATSMGMSAGAIVGAAILIIGTITIVIIAYRRKHSFSADGH
jgi:hypothetical protein